MHGSRIRIMIIFVALQGLVACKDQPAPATPPPVVVSSSPGLKSGNETIVLEADTSTNPPIWKDHHKNGPNDTLRWKAKQEFTILFLKDNDPCNPNSSGTGDNPYPSTMPVGHTRWMAECTINTTKPGPFPYRIDSPQPPSLIKEGKPHIFTVTRCGGCVVELDSGN